ncbi:MAG TPA: 2-oxoacid:acceptor oxidoreductase family protein [Acidimicrobiales bacterium]|nr:2-oxoacid:acceptor oxidoreductase family protein [Acidimicrobiales bacterium]HYB91764.1 2-oxoacid:acceptor oxidoreductase family protein [Candidatus Binataceae bacterium]
MNEKRAVPRYPGVPSVTDGTGAVVWVETHVSQGACVYPITPSTNMGVGYAEAVANGERNLWGEPLVFTEPESEHSSASAAEGFALAGGRVTNFTSGQGLILMKEVLYTISGKRLPAVFNIGARALTSQSLNIHAGHDDVMAVADTGWGMLFGRNAQEAADLGLIARRASEDTRTPFLNIQDGFLTTHTLESVRLPEPEFMREFVGAPADRLINLADPSNPMQSGPVQNQDSYMKGKIAQRYFYDHVEDAVVRAMEEFQAATGRRYGLIDSYLMDDAEYAIVAMGSMAETAMATASYMRSKRGVACGVVSVTCVRPFPGPQLVAALGRCRRIAVVERMDNPLAQSNPLTAELKAAFADALAGDPAYGRLKSAPEVFSGSAGLGGRDIRPGDFVAAFENLVTGNKRYFVLGIHHPLALERESDPDVRPAGSFSMRGYSVGGYGSVTTNRLIATLVAEMLDLNVQAFPLYGSEKKGLPTNYFLTAASEHILTHCELEHIEFVSLNNVNAFALGNPLAGIAKEGTVFVQTSREDPEEVWQGIPEYARRIIHDQALRVVYLDAARIAEELSSREDLQIRMQGIVLLGVFLRSMPYLQKLALPESELFARVENAIRRYFGRQGERVVKDNMSCVRRGFDQLKEVPRALIMRGASNDALAAAGGE